MKASSKDADSVAAISSRPEGAQQLGLLPAETTSAQPMPPAPNSQPIFNNQEFENELGSIMEQQEAAANVGKDALPPPATLVRSNACEGTTCLTSCVPVLDDHMKHRTGQ